MVTPCFFLLPSLFLANFPFFIIWYPLSLTYRYPSSFPPLISAFQLLFFSLSFSYSDTFLILHSCNFLLGSSYTLILSFFSFSFLIQIPFFSCLLLIHSLLSLSLPPSVPSYIIPFILIHHQMLQSLSRVQSLLLYHFHLVILASSF